MTAEVEKCDKAKSGFRCAELQYSTLKVASPACLFGELRFRGIAAMTRLGFADRIVIIGGKEDRYPDEHISRSEAFKAILEKDFGAAGEIVAHTQSGTTTSMDAYSVMEREMGGFAPENYALVSSKYHLARLEAQMSGLYVRHIPRWPAEAFLLVEDPDRFQSMLEAFGEGDLAFRDMLELRGIASVLTGTYKPLPA